MRICVVGAGAIGGLLAATLAIAGESVSVIDRGAHLKAVGSRGLKVVWSDGTILAAKVRAFDSARSAGEQDLVILGVKAYDLAHVASGLKFLLGRDTTVMTLQNGIPWWYFQKEGGRFDGRRLQSVDPNGILSGTIDPDRIIGCVAYPAATLVAPGIIRHIEGDRFPIGELDGSDSERARALSRVLVNAGFKSRVLTDIRSELWLKALGNVSLNPISALTRSTMSAICRNAPTRRIAATMMAEAHAIAAELGIHFRRSIEQRLDGAEKVGEHKTSMLQDLEAGNPLEVEALLGSVLEIGKLTNVPAPTIEAVYGLVKLLDQTMLERPGAAPIESAA